VSFTITLQCPTHPLYKANVRPLLSCPICLVMFGARNEMNKVLSIEPEERTEATEQCIRSVA
jgi:hypothetical protein